MSRKYKFNNAEGLYFVSFTTIKWIDVFTRNIYRDIIVESLNFCIQKKGLIVYAWAIMTNHVHLIVGSQALPLEGIMRDMKSFTSRKIVEAIRNNAQESRKEWILWMFDKAGEKNPNNQHAQFWQQHSHPMELGLEEADIERALSYIHDNPVKAGFVSKDEEFLYSSAMDYAGEKGLVDIKML